MKQLSIEKESNIQQLIEWDKRHYIHPTTSPKQLVENGAKLIFSEGQGIYIKDVHGETYIDGMSMLWNVNIGHGRKELALAAQEQMEKVAYASSFVGFSNEPAIKLAHKLAELAPGDLNSVFFTSGGSESNDTAFKFSRFYWELQGQPKKTKIISLNKGYHGVTIASQTATRIPGFHDFSNSKAVDILEATPHLTNCERGDKSDPNYRNSIRGIIEQEGSDTIAAIILEPIQGSGGVNIPPQDYLKAVRDLCDEMNILFIADEVICGFGRTGKMFGVDHWDIVPDIMCVAKGISSGYTQLGAVLMRDKLREAFVQVEDVLTHGFTYSGHPTACAVALKNLEIIEEEQIVANSAAMEKELIAGFKYLEEKHHIVGNSRSFGVLAAIEFFEDRDSGKLFDNSVRVARDVVDECFKRKLILRNIDFFKGVNIVAIAPPLVINKKEVGDLIQILDDSITVVKINCNL